MSITQIPTSLSKGTMWLSPSSPANWPASGSSSSQPIHIAVLDSSFNPPTLAHLALASAPFPAGPSPTVPEGYTARLLLFSLSNVEKKPQPTDPSLSQRLHMISLLAARLPNTAFGLIDEPTFVGKSQIIHSHLSNLSSNPSAVRLSFIVGTDTLIRFFDPRFYGSVPGGMDAAFERFFEAEGSTLISARRGGESERETEEALLARREVRRWVEIGKLRLFGLGTEPWVGMSSTQVRQALTRGDGEGLDRLVIPEIAKYLVQEGLYLNKNT